MAADYNRQKISQLKQQLEECKKVIKKAKMEAETELKECQADYQEACKEFDRIKRDYHPAGKAAGKRVPDPSLVYLTAT